MRGPGAGGITVTPPGHDKSMELERMTPARTRRRLAAAATPHSRSSARRLEPAGHGGPRGTATKSSPRLRQVGLVGIAQAREALAEAARRAELRADHKAA